ncbi:MAG: DUF1499 domain-containing protein [Thiolinea sp.]
MKTLILIVLLLLVAGLVYFFVLGYQSRNGSAPGLQNGRLSACSGKPNCVNSEAAPDSEFHIDPLASGDPSTALERMQAAIRAAGGQIQQQTTDYLAATFQSRLFGFVDDLEVRLEPAQQLLQIRSASRVGYSDMGANRKRVEQLRQIFNNQSDLGG